MTPKEERKIIFDFIEYIHNGLQAFDLEFGKPGENIKKFKCHTHNNWSYSFGKYVLEIKINVKEF